MKIAIDIDKTIFNCNSLLYQIINTYLIYQKVDTDLKYKEVDLDKYKPYVNKFIKKLSRMHNPDFYKPEKRASCTINKCIEEGDEIILLSSRPPVSSIISSLLLCLKKHNIKFSKFVVACNNKAVYCKKNDIDLLIDDSRFICENANQLKINTLLYTAKYDKKQSQKLSKKFNIAASWSEVNSYLQKLKRGSIICMDKSK